MPACRHDSSLIVAQTYSSANNVDYGITVFNWNYYPGILDPSITNPTTSDSIWVSWPTGEIHTVTLQTINQWGCYNGAGLMGTVTEPAPFNPSYTLDPTTCMNSNGHILLSTANGGQSNYYTFNWLPNQPPITNLLAVNQSNLNPLTSYQVVVNGQSLSLDAAPGTYCHDTISIFVPDTGEIVAQFDTMMLEQHMAAPYDVQFVNTTINGRKYSWRIYNESGELVGTSTLEDPLYSFTDEGCYQIVLVATSKQGCVDTMAYNPLCVDAFPVLEIPNVFTPNNDGNNDLFRVHGKSILEFHAVVFNRWGKKIYEWDDVNGYWDGKIGSSDASPGTYYYKITAKGKKETDYEFNGFFYLLREK
jgi:gliding motility-associated-like protein